MNDELEDDETEHEPTELEKQYQALVEDVQAKIEEHVKAACKALTKAVKLADKHGVSFHSSISFLDQDYYATPQKDFWNLNQDFINDTTDTYNEYGGEGWQHSDVC